MPISCSPTMGFAIEYPCERKQVQDELAAVTGQGFEQEMCLTCIELHVKRDMNVRAVSLECSGRGTPAHLIVHFEAPHQRRWHSSFVDLSLDVSGRHVLRTKINVIYQLTCCLSCFALRSAEDAWCTRQSGCSADSPRAPTRWGSRPR